MKKNLLVLLLSLAAGVSVNGQAVSTRPWGDPSKEGQKKVIDTATIRCYYLVETKLDGQLRSDTMVLDIGTRYSRFYNPARLNQDSVVQAVMTSMDPATIKSISVLKDANARDLSSMPGTTVASSSNEGESYRIVKERTANRLVYSDNTSALGDTYQYEEDLGALPWKLGDEKTIILSYPANGASLTFRGRNYKAWFTPEIPVNDGPWKFMGLPGLIVKIADDKEEIRFSLIGVEQLRAAVPIRPETGKIFKCSRADLVKLKKQQDAGMQINNNAGALTISSMPGPFNYFAIELE